MNECIVVGGEEMEYKIVPIAFKAPTYVPIKVPTYVPIQASKQEPMRLLKLPVDLNEKCRKAEVMDCVAYTIFHIGETSLGNWLKTEEEKPLKQWNWGAVVLGEFLKFGCSLAKDEINKNLCNPIGNN